MKEFRAGDKVQITNDTKSYDIGVNESDFELIKSKPYLVIESTYLSYARVYVDIENGQILDRMINMSFLESAETENKEESTGESKMENQIEMRVKYFGDAVRLKKIEKGNWIDVYANKDVFIPEKSRKMIPLGFALELPAGWEAHLAPRSSTLKSWGLIQGNSVGVIDDTFIGDNDQWHFPAFCVKGNTTESFELYDDDDNNVIASVDVKGTWVSKGDKIGQFRIMKAMPPVTFKEVESFGNADRGGFGTTGTK